MESPQLERTHKDHLSPCTAQPQQFHPVPQNAKTEPEDAAINISHLESTESAGRKT